MYLLSSWSGNQFMGLLWSAISLNVAEGRWWQFASARLRV